MNYYQYLTDKILSLSIAAVADYVGIRSMELTFGPTVAEHAIPVTVINDSALEYTESFHVVLSADNEQIVNFLDQQATVWILDDDGEDLVAIWHSHHINETGG